MTGISYDVTAIGNAIVDIIGRCDDAFLAKHGRTAFYKHSRDEIPPCNRIWLGNGFKAQRLTHILKLGSSSNQSR